MLIPEDMMKETVLYNFNSEKKHGFVISEVMKRSWAADIKMLNEVLDICREIDVRLFACYGTLLGAVREHGYIPWDDDLDMGLVGEDYVRFIETIANDYSDRYSILNPYTRTWYKMNFSHMINGSEVTFNREYLKKWCGCPFMTGLDIYPYYYIPRNKDDEEFILEVLGKIDNTIALSRQAEALSNETRRLDDLEKVREVLANELVNLQHLTGCSFSTDRPIENQLEILYDQVCRIADEQNSDYVTRYDEYAKNRNKKYPKEYLKNIVYIPFEHAKMPCPIGYDDVLIKRFGERYIVPRQERGAHDYPYYKKQICDKDYYEEEVRKGIRIDFLDNIHTENISDPSFKKHVRRRLYHTSAYEMLIHSDFAIATIKDTLTDLMNDNDGAELWWMPDVFLKTDDCAMDMVAPMLIEEYETLIRQYAEKGVMFINVSDKYEDLISCFDEYYGDAGILAEKFQKARKKVILHEFKVSAVNANPDVSASIKKSCDIPELWRKIIEREDGSLKKVILYVTEIGMLYRYREKIIDKIRSVLKTFFDSREDITLIWRKQAINGTDVEAFPGSFVDEMNKLQKEFEAGGWGILDTTDDPEVAIKLADAIYGDKGYIVARCMEKGIPVMIQNPDII